MIIQFKRNGTNVTSNYKAYGVFVKNNKSGKPSDIINYKQFKIPEDSNIIIVGNSSNIADNNYTKCSAIIKDNWSSKGVICIIGIPRDKIMSSEDAKYILDQILIKDLDIEDIDIGYNGICDAYIENDILFRGLKERRI